MVLTGIVLGLGLILALIVAFIVIALLIQITTAYGMRCWRLRPSPSAVFYERITFAFGEPRRSIGSDAMKPQSDLRLQHKGELISARTKLLRAIGPENNEILDALREDWTAVWPKGKPLLIGYHFAWPKKEVRLENSILSEKLFEAHKALNALIRDYQSAPRPNVVFIADLPYEIGRRFRMAQHFGAQ
ncbi:MAG: hypothetical protein JO121_12550 [Deltaproteobacteria bacterium]|nr:hypothetical protein [Deltaproteobacteria bacterium]